MPDFLKRFRERRVLRARREHRDDLLLELGALVFELHRQGERAPDLLQARAAELDVVDHEVRVLEGSLGPDAQDATDAVSADGEQWDGEQATGDWEHGDAWEQSGEPDPGSHPTAEETVPDESSEETHEWQAPEGQA
jgi:hypothetical protein